MYDASGQRVAKYVNGTMVSAYLYDNAGRMVTELDGALNAVRREVYAGGRHLGTYDQNGNLTYSLTDWLGTERAMATSAGVLCETLTSQPFGDNQQTSGTCSPTNKFFTGKERDAESGLDYFGARYYASNMGRWMSPDWSAKYEPVPYAKLDNPQSLNLYAYVLNNPLSNRDEDGHATDPDTPAQKAQKNVDNAKTSKGTDRYDIKATVVSNGQVFKSGSDKCNLYVSENQKNSTGEHTVVEGTGKIPSAAQFADPNVKITGLSAPEPLANARPGDAIAQDHGPGANGNEEGHVGVVISLPHDGQPGQTASANANEGGRVTINDWGFRSPTAAKNNGERHGADSPPPVVRHPQ